MSKIIKITKFFMFFQLIFISQGWAIVGGTTLNPVETCTAGSTQKKYTASGCTYTTSTRECCGLIWSGWGEECPKTCDPATKPATTGSCGTDGSGTWSRTVTCNTDTLQWETGNWGTCSYCTPGEEVSGFDNGCSIWQVATCNWNGTAYNCGCSASKSEEMRRCYEYTAGPVWSTKMCQCYCCGAGSTYVPADNNLGFTCTKNYMQVMPNNCSAAEMSDSRF